MYWAGGTSIVLEPAYHTTIDTLDLVSQERMGLSAQIIGGSVLRAALNAVEVDVIAAAPLDRLRGAYRAGRQFELDGLSVDCDDWWFNLRASNTQPLLRLNVEAETEDILREKTTEVLELIRK